MGGLGADLFRSKLVRLNRSTILQTSRDQGLAKAQAYTQRRPGFKQRPGFNPGFTGASTVSIL